MNKITPQSNHEEIVGIKKDIDWLIKTNWAILGGILVNIVVVLIT